MFPLPYHRNAFYATQAGRVVRAQAKGDEGNKLWFDYLSYVFEHQDRLYNDPTHNLSAAAVVDELAEMGKACCGVSKAVTESGMKYGDNFDANSRLMWKQGAARGVFGTPQFFVNSVYATSDTLSFDAWESLINSLGVARGAIDDEM
jgi:hypothetical protein